jgi:hypothetical protein
VAHVVVELVVVELMLEIPKDWFSFRKSRLDIVCDLEKSLFRVSFL